MIHFYSENQISCDSLITFAETRLETGFDMMPHQGICNLTNSIGIKDVFKKTVNLITPWKTGSLEGL